MTIHKYAAEYYNPSGASANTPASPTYDQTKPTQPPRRRRAWRMPRCTQPGCPIWTCNGSTS